MTVNEVCLVGLSAQPLIKQLFGLPTGTYAFVILVFPHVTVFFNLKINLKIKMTL